MQKRFLDRPNAKVLYNKSVVDVLGAERISGVLLEDTDEVRRPDEVARASDAGPAPVAPVAAAPSPEERPRRPRTGPEDPVGRGLAWLALHQAPDGRFGAQDFGRWCRGVAWEGPAVPGAGLASPAGRGTPESRAVRAYAGARLDRVMAAIR